MILCAKRARAFALKKVGRMDEAKVLMQEVVQQKIEDDAATKAKKAEEAKAVEAAA